MAKKKKLFLSIENPSVQATILKWKEKRSLIQKKTNTKIITVADKTISAEKTKIQRTSVRTISKIENKEEIDAAVDCFIWPSPVYNRKDDFYIQAIVGKNKELLTYYHQRMKAYFGVQHVLKKEFNAKKRVIKSIKEHDSNTTPTHHFVVNTDKKIEPNNTQQTNEEPKQFVKGLSKVKTWVLDWDFVDFEEGHFIIHSPNSNEYKFASKKVICEKARTSFNYLRKYIKEKLPPIFCMIANGELTINSPLLIDQAIETFTKIAKQKGMIVPKNSKKNTPPIISFQKAMSRAIQMTPEDFFKYKSEYINFLLEKQSQNYKVIPCVERLAHINSDITEDSFLFSIKCKSGNVLVVQENVNPDRATILFIINGNSYDKSIKHIYSFLQGTEINKRSSIRNRSVLVKELSIRSYSSIDHDDLQTWQKVLMEHINKERPEEKMQRDPIKAKYSSISKLLRETQTKHAFKATKPVFEMLNLPLDRRVKPAHIFALLPQSKYEIDKNGNKVIPRTEGRWSLEFLIKLLTK